jgi:hypothetical protein
MHYQMPVISFSFSCIFPLSNPLKFSNESKNDIVLAEDTQKIIQMMQANGVAHNDDYTLSS